MSTGSDALPDGARRYLSDRALTPLWDAARRRLERNGLDVRGVVTVTADEVTADRLSGLLGRGIGAGQVRIRLDDLDQTLRRSAAGRGLVSLLEALDGRQLVDRAGDRRADADRWAALWRRLDADLAAADLAGSFWVPGWIAGLRRTGILTRAGADAATRAVRHAVTGLGLLADTSAACLRADAPGVVGPVTQVRWELGELASRVSGTAHGLDAPRLAAAVLLRAAAPALGVAAPRSAAERRELWQALGVATDALSGTVLAYGLRPPGADRWSAMMRDRADLGLVTHLTGYELERAGPVRFTDPGRPVGACENPQVIQAAARAGVDAPLLCLSGNPATVGMAAVRTLVEAGNPVRYHGDFDWPGLAIAGRVIAAGARPWRMSAEDYRYAVAHRLDADHAVALTGAPVPVDWDPDLADALAATGLAVHEESVLDLLIDDLRAGLG